MTRKLLVVFASGLLLATVSSALAWMMGGAAVTAAFTHGHGWTFDGADGADGRDEVRNLAFDPGQPLDISMPGTLHYRRGAVPALSIRGPKALVEAVHADQGRLSLGAGAWLAHVHGLTVEIVAPRMPALTWSGAGAITLDDVRQPQLDLTLSGAGNVEAEGHVDRVALRSSGAGNVDLEALMAHDATVEVSGVGNVDLSADGTVDASISGAGNVSLHRKPAVLTSRVSGLGSVDEDY
ncbi:MAG: DUF2807 domain-containing protein [Sphingomonadales bacterium]|nr:DUF2807 domain-containing protein [Sphingomonadales bacterium]